MTHARPETEGSSIATRRGWFTTTHWSVIWQASQPGAANSQAGLEQLYRRYRQPLFGFIRSRGYSEEDAEDLVQGFFAKAIEKEYFGKADPQKGRFRSFLLMALTGFLCNEHDKRTSQKRGGGQPTLPLQVQAQDSETVILEHAVDHMSPEKIFDRQWALALLEQVLNRLRAECDAAGNARSFEELKCFLSGAEPKRPYGEIAMVLGVNEVTLRGSVLRLKRRYRELLLQEIADTVEGPEAVEDELRHLMASLS